MSKAMSVKIAPEQSTGTKIGQLFCQCFQARDLMYVWLQVMNFLLIINLNFPSL